jgi:hypothetical protein
VTLTITGTASLTGVTGSIQALGVTFAIVADPVTGTTSGLAGLFQGSDLSSASGTTYTVVGTQGEVFVLAVTPTGVAGGVGTVNAADGSYTVTLGAAGTVAGTINSAAQTATGTVTTATGGTLSFSAPSSALVPIHALVDESALGSVTPGSPLTVGFVVGGQAAKAVVLRGVGPGLAAYGTVGPLAKPQLTLYNAAGAVLGTNSAWGGTAALSAAFAQVGAFPLAPSSSDTALTATLPPGPYTFVVSDAANDAGGSALAEVYDASIDLSGTTQSLTNCSTLGQVSAGNPLESGFVIVGNTSRTVLIRAVGPSLGSYGVTSPLADPALVVSTQTGAVVAQNNDWGTPSGSSAASASDLAAAAAGVGAFPLTAGSKDSALVVSLAPGHYSAIVSGNAAGTVLLEVYVLP